MAAVKPGLSETPRAAKNTESSVATPAARAQLETQPAVHSAVAVLSSGTLLKAPRSTLVNALWISRPLDL